MKRILALSLSAALLLVLLGACTGADPETTVISPDPAGESATVPPADTTQEPSLALPTEEPTEEVSAEPSAEPSEEPSQAPATQPPATQPPATQAPAVTHHPETHHPEETHHPAPSPTVPGGGIVLPGPGGAEEPTAEPSKAPDGFTEPTGPSASDVNLTNFYQTVLNSYAFPPMEVLPTDFIANMFPGLASIPAVQRVVSVPMMSGTASALVLVQVTNSSDVSAVKAILQDHVNTQIARNANYPAVVDAYQNNIQIVSHDSYVMLVVHESCDAIVSQFNALF